MERSFRNGVVLLAGLGLIGLSLSFWAILLEADWRVWLPGVVGLGLFGWGAWSLRVEIGAMVRRRRGEVALYTAGTLGVLILLGYLSTIYTTRIDMTSQGRYSLSPQTIEVLERVEKPVHITFYYDPMLREPKELLELYGRYTDKLTFDFYDPNLNPAQARMQGVLFAGTTVLESDSGVLKISGIQEADFTNAILRITQGDPQLACFLDGHNEADPLSRESHEHLEGTMGSHQHGLGSRYVLHEKHGLAKARHALESTNFKVEKFLLAQGEPVPEDCSVLIVAGPKIPLLPREVDSISRYLRGGGSAMFMLDPFVETGLEPILTEYGIMLEDDIVIDETNHFWSDLSSPAVTSYPAHLITRQLPLTFFPGVRSVQPAPRRDPAVSAEPIVVTSRSSYGETDRKRPQFDRGEDVEGPLTIMVLAVKRFGREYSIEFGKTTREEQPAPAVPANGTSGAAAGGSPQEEAGPGGQYSSRLLVVGDSDFATNSFFHFLGNGNLFLNAVNYLAARENLIGIEPPTYDLPRVSLTNRQMKGTFFLAIVLIPAISALVGIGVWWKQR